MAVDDLGYSVPGPRQYPISKELLNHYDKLNAEYGSAAAINRKNSLFYPINAWWTG